MVRGHLVLEQAIGQIRRGSQYRRDPDEDLDELCGSLERVGILNPPAITAPRIGSVYSGHHHSMTTCIARR